MTLYYLIFNAIVTQYFLLQSVTVTLYFLIFNAIVTLYFLLQSVTADLYFPIVKKTSDSPVLRCFGEHTRSGGYSQPVVESFRKRSLICPVKSHLANSKKLSKFD